MRKKRKIILLLLLLYAVLLAIAFRISYCMSVKDNNKLVTIRLGQSDEQQLQYNLFVSESWSDSGNWDTVGAEYDFEIINYSKQDFYNWTITVKFGKDCTVDALWNGELLSNSGGELVIKPLEYNEHVWGAGGRLPFGMVLISKDVLDIESITISGYFLTEWSDNVMFMVCVVLSAIWVVATVFTLIIYLRIASYEKRQKRDEAIIIHTMDTLVDFIEAKDEYTHGHSKRVAEYTRKIAEKMRIPKDVVRDYYYIALMHDCGKIGIPDEILNKEEKLTEEEFELIKTHTTMGAQMLSKFTDIKGIQDGALQHHEKYDGTGYPNGLKGEEISLIGRIICVADCFDAMNIDRCYRNGISQDKIVIKMKEESGKQFDPEILKVFLSLLNDGEIITENR